MKRKKTALFVVISSFALLALLIIQVRWMMRSAGLREELFNQKATMVLCRTVEDLCSDRETCMSIGSCCMKGDGDCTLKLDPIQKGKIDSLIRHYLNFYQVPSSYRYQVLHVDDPALIYKTKKGEYSGRRLIANAGENEIVLKLILPRTSYFILAEMGSMFACSVLLVALLIILFTLSIRAMLREKRLLQNTKDFVNNMTHEFKTPMSSLGLASGMLEKEDTATNPVKVKEYASIIHKENKRLQLQVEKLLEITALERGELKLKESVVDLHEIIRSAVDSIGIQIKVRQGKIVSLLDASLSWVKGDTLYLGNAISNLLDNAAKYSETTPDIIISTRNEDGQLLVSVCDKGIGIRKEQQTQVFDMFYRVPAGDVHDTKGFGIGLAYVKKIVVLHKGSIRLQSEPGKGSCFMLLFPLARR